MAQEEAGSQPQAKKAKKKQAKEYLPGVGTANYALMIALFQVTAPTCRSVQFREACLKYRRSQLCWHYGQAKNFKFPERSPIAGSQGRKSTPHQTRLDQ